MDTNRTERQKCFEVKTVWPPKEIMLGAYLEVPDDIKRSVVHLIEEKIDDLFDEVKRIIDDEVGHIA